MQTMPRYSSASREYQRTFDFPPPEYIPPRDPAKPHRREAAALILALTAAPEIRALIERGQITTGEHVRELAVATFVRDQHQSLRRFVELIATADLARDQRHREAAFALLQRFDTLPDAALAEELKALGLCDSTKSFGRPIGNFRYLLFKFRRVMKKQHTRKRHTEL